MDPAETFVTGEHPGGNAKVLLYGKRASAYMALKRFKLAREDCRHLVKTHPHSKNPKYLNRLARCNLALGSHDAARDVLHRVLRIEPENPNAIHLLAEAARLKAKLANLDREIKNKN
jgi:DnaJ homolog subfamily C member 7